MPHVSCMWLTCMRTAPLHLPKKVSKKPSINHIGSSTSHQLKPLKHKLLPSLLLQNRECFQFHFVLLTWGSLSHDALGTGKHSGIGPCISPSLKMIILRGTGCLSLRTSNKSHVWICTLKSHRLLYNNTYIHFTIEHCVQKKLQLNTNLDTIPWSCPNVSHY